jgi:hypothetical protein
MVLCPVVGWWLVGVEVDFFVKGLQSIGDSVYLLAGLEIIVIAIGLLGIESLVMECLFKFCFQVVAFG